MKNNITNDEILYSLLEEIGFKLIEKDESCLFFKRDSFIATFYLSSDIGHWTLEDLSPSGITTYIDKGTISELINFFRENN